ncbi:hypothetical protein BLA24_31375 [Streptomyces cinnamoneus]|uniref:Uncharacterized protein n=1 Tax=Streptomyces cinnamoneus TaxID=53446 RepID=A0A2G1X9R4_STRCJ|nr:hypothetical protein [Streptomyces cinnamoneus]PHQ47966.1 hypothetical protein BLA24_31375 [Streptomyces cinnamoneus]PPT15590.1 hypothetical protein CYQ11_24415 [Streptomyces cinnamoneus]
MGSAVTFGELGRLRGEELPPRIALSSVLLPAGTDQPVYPTLVRTEHGTTVAYACQYRQNPGSPGLLVALGLAPSAPGYTTTCVPAAISSP